MKVPKFLDERLAIHDLRQFAHDYQATTTPRQRQVVSDLLKGNESADFYLGLMQGLMMAGGIAFEKPGFIAHMAGAVAMLIERKEIS